MTPPAAQTPLWAPGGCVAFGVDPGSKRCGWGVVRREGRKLERLASGLIHPQESLPTHRRLGFIADRLDTLVANWPADVVGCEDTFVGKNQRTALVVGSARGVVMAAAGKAGRRFRLINNASAKAAVACSGRAGKAEVQRGVRAILGYDEELGKDEADALAIAICACLALRRRA